MATLYYKDKKVDDNLRYLKVSEDGELIEPKLESQTIDVTENGTTEITPSANYDGLSSVTVNVDVPMPTFTTEDRTLDVTENGTYNVTPNDGYDGLLNVQINVAVEDSNGSFENGYNEGYNTGVVEGIAQQKNKLTTLTITENGTYINEDGYNEVTVAVEGQGGLDFSQIGYSNELTSELNTKYNADIAYSKTLYDAWNPSNTSAYMKYGSDTKLVYAPAIETTNVTNMGFLFNGCSQLIFIPPYNTSSVTNMGYLFNGCVKLTSIPPLDTSLVTVFGGMFGLTTSLQRIEGITLKSAKDSSFGSYFIFNGTSNPSIRYCLIKDIGYQQDLTIIRASYMENWGVNSADVTDARQSVIDSLITYSFDRATAGYPTCTIKLSTNTKALLTEDEIAQITNKGYTIA